MKGAKAPSSFTPPANNTETVCFGAPMSGDRFVFSGAWACPRRRQGHLVL
eukprot:NODE_4431_length_471_cov_47.462085_g3811_i0.p2 GENE.NODE_4431_length_471_cov_47.462085_g3811_i0~~NODE_4431_length_471_cov_47.462085_g3811_i0.p2  ORF type:complete len:50 (+),score=10.69 NODE_4431_length_471_cov_47.462085_g3811_i0:286-435(+)